MCLTFRVLLQNESLAVQKKFQAEIARVEDALMQVRRDYELLRMKYEHYLKTNEQTGAWKLYFLNFP